MGNSAEDVSADTDVEKVFKPVVNASKNVKDKELKVAPAKKPTLDTDKLMNKKLPPELQGY